MNVKASEVVEAARQLVRANVPYVWWREGDPIPMWWYSYGAGPPPPDWMAANGTMCSDLINWARMECGLEYVGGTPAYYDWLIYNGGEDFNANNPGVPGALACNPGVWRGGSGQGHIVLFSDEHTLIQATDGVGNFAGVNEGEDDRETVSWWTPWVYGLMPDVDYSEVIDDAPEPVPALNRPRWVSVDRDGWLRADGPDWSRGWYAITDDGKLSGWRGPGEA